MSQLDLDHIRRIVLLFSDKTFLHFCLTRFCGRILFLILSDNYCSIDIFAKCL